MKLYGALVLMVTLSAAWGLRCHVCQGNKDCKNEANCPEPADRCSTVEVAGIYTKGCLTQAGCKIGNIKCCEGDLCNSAITTGSSVLLLLLSSAIITIFL